MHAYRDAGDLTSHFLAVTGDTPATAAALAGVCPSNIILTIRSRPSGVSLAFLCMFSGSTAYVHAGVSINDGRAEVRHWSGMAKGLSG